MLNGTFFLVIYPTTSNLRQDFPKLYHWLISDRILFFPVIQNDACCQWPELMRPWTVSFRNWFQCCAYEDKSKGSNCAYFRGVIDLSISKPVNLESLYKSYWSDPDGRCHAHMPQWGKSIFPQVLQKVPAACRTQSRICQLSTLSLHRKFYYGHIKSVSEVVIRNIVIVWR